ncbi:MAG: sugar ABC transporter permease [Spirochaetales bacterium]|nr:sugar ABC transporter permease [Spirochaetales bacterium]
MEIRSEKKTKIIIYFIFILPALIVYLAVVAFPVITSVFLSFTDYNVYKNEATVVGMKHYIKMMKDDIFWTALANNFIIVFISVFGQIPIGFMLAYILYRKIVGMEKFFQAMVYLPAVISTIVVGILWNKMFSAVGGITKLLQLLYNDPHYMIQILNEKFLAFIPLSVVFIWMYTGFYMIVFLANLQKIDPAILEASQIDGASESQIFFKVIMPSLRGVIVITAILAISGSLKGFDLLFALTNGGPAGYTEVLAIYMYRYTFIINNYGFGSAVSTVIVLISVILIALTRFINSRFGEEVN